MAKEIDYFGNEMWKTDEGILHRVDGPAITYANGDRYWYRNGNRHRDDGPASILSHGTLYWFRENELHREDGPAVIEDGNYEWYLCDKRYSFDEFCKALKLSGEDKLMLKLKYYK